MLTRKSKNAIMLLLRSLEYTNYFVERFVEENLPEWMQTKDLPEEKKAELRTAYQDLSK